MSDDVYLVTCFEGDREDGRFHTMPKAALIDKVANTIALVQPLLAHQPLLIHSSTKALWCSDVISDTVSNVG